MRKDILKLLVFVPILAAIVPVQNAAAQEKGNAPAPKNSSAKSRFKVYRAGPWEEKIGYSQAVRAGER